MITKKEAWEALEKASKLVGFASEARDIPDNLRDRLIEAMATLIWTSESIKCPTCGAWRTQSHDTNG
jgi:hypothetical protein